MSEEEGSRRMKILIVRGFPEKINLGGYNVQETGLASALRRKGQICDIVFFGGNEPEHEEVRPDGTKIIWLPGKNLLKAGIMPSVKKLAQQYDVLQLQEYDQLQSWLLYTFGKKPAVIYHGPYFDAFNHGYNAKCRVFDHLFLPFSGRAKRKTMCLTKSPLAEDFLREKGFSHVKSVGVGFDASSMEDGSEPRDNAVTEAMPEDAWNLFYVGKLEERRNIPFLLDVMEQAATQYPKSGGPKNRSRIHCVIVGTGEETYLEQVMPRIREMENRGILSYIPKASQKELGPAYEKADIFLFPTQYDIFGMVLLEAMYHGCACISSRNGGSATLLTPENGVELQDFALKDWTDAVLRLLADPSSLAAVKERAKERVRDHGQWDQIADLFLEAYQYAISQEAFDKG